jgi:hypothetical protein
MSRTYSRFIFAIAITMTLAMVACSNSGSGSSSAISLSLSPSSAKSIDQTLPLTITANLVNDATFKGVTWTLTGPGSLANSVGPSTTYNPQQGLLASPQQATVVATSVADPTKSASLQITVNPAALIPTQTLPNGSVGVAYNQTIQVVGGTSPFQWSIYNGPIITGSSIGGALPDGLKLDANTGTISGTPTGAGTWFFEATVADAAGGGSSNGFLSIQINAPLQSANPVPFLDQTLAPMAVSPGGPNIPLRVSGSGFVSGATINFNGTPLITGFIDSEHLTSILNTANTAKAGTPSVTVVNPAPGGGSSNVVYFQVGTPESAVTFANAPNSPLQAKVPLGLTVADFNEDGKPDIAVAAGLQLATFLGNGDGTFASAAGSPINVPSPPYNNFGSPYTGPIVAGDFNNSGHLGVAIAEYQNEAAVIYLGNGTGSFTPSSATFADSLGNPVSGLQPADFNADGELDLAIINEFTGQSPLNLGFGNGAFSHAGDLSTGVSSTGIAAGDFNGDGKLDTVTVNGGTVKEPTAGVVVSLGVGDGTFTSASNLQFLLGQNLSAVAAADFNGDGKLDIAVTDFGGNCVFILLGNGDGTFGTPITIPVGIQPDAITTGDFNNDGKLDLAVANFGDNTVTLLLSNGDGTFTASSGSPYPVGQGPTSIAAADFNGDGKLDLATSNLSDNTVSVLLQQ